MALKKSGMIQQVKAELTTAFSMADIGPISFYLGLKVERNQEKQMIKLSQPAYINKILSTFHLDKAHLATIPMKESALPEPHIESQASATKKERYQGMTGSIMFSMVETRPDIAFATSVVARFAKNPGHQHIEAAKTVLRYLKGLRERGITFGGQDKLLVEGYSDFDWAGDKEDQKSTSGFIFMLNGRSVSWRSKKQATVALLSTEAEYIALTLAAKKATWLRLLLTELGLLQPDKQHALIKVLEQNKSTQAIQDHSNEHRGGGELEIIMPLKGDNQGSIALIHNPVFHSRTKHINIQHHYIRDEVASKRIELSYVPTEKMIADGLTKALTYVKFLRFVNQMRMT